MICMPTLTRLRAPEHDFVLSEPFLLLCTFGDEVCQISFRCVLHHNVQAIILQHTFIIMYDVHVIELGKHASLS